MVEIPPGRSRSVGQRRGEKTLVAPRELDCDGGVAGAPVPSFPLIIAHSIVRNSHRTAAVGLSHLASLRMRYGGGPLFTLGALTRKSPRPPVGIDPGDFMRFYRDEVESWR